MKITRQDILVILASFFFTALVCAGPFVMDRYRSTLMPTFYREVRIEGHKVLVFPRAGVLHDERLCDMCRRRKK